MKVLHVEVGGSYGGSLRALETYLRHCDRSAMGHIVLLYYPTPGCARLESLAEVRTLYGEVPAWIRNAAPVSGSLRSTLSRSRTVRIVHPWLRLCGQLPSLRDLRRAISRVAPDLLHVNNTFSYQAPTLLAARTAGIRALAHVRNPVEHTAYNRYLARLACALMVCNGVLARDLREWCTTVPVHTCYDGAETAPVDGRVSEGLRRDLLGDGRFLLGSLGRLDTQKGYDDLIEAAGLVCARRPDVRFAIAGEGPLRNHLQERIERLGLASQVCLCGFRPDPANFLAALDLFVCSSVYEGGPLVLAEAMALRKPVVSTVVGFAPELVVEEGSAGGLTPCSDPRALAASMLRLLESAADAAMLERGRMAALRLCDPAIAAQRLDDCFRECAEGSPAVRRAGTHAA